MLYEERARTALVVGCATSSPRSTDPTSRTSGWRWKSRCAKWRRRQPGARARTQARAASGENRGIRCADQETCATSATRCGRTQGLGDAAAEANRSARASYEAVPEAIIRPHFGEAIASVTGEHAFEPPPAGPSSTAARCRSATAVHQAPPARPAGQPRDRGRAVGRQTTMTTRLCAPELLPYGRIVDSPCCCW